ncbi:MAG: ABC transporter ATP-binding protein [Ignavibacteriaceae bacterium]|nr:ABC transporter ATP-binding protein [Ignavibacteriaceae bacterium]
MIQFKDLTKKFGSFTAVNSIDLHIRKGALYGFLGPNGAGKSTTIKMLTGIYSLSGGDIVVDGMSILKYPQKIKMITGYIPDQPYLYDRLTGKEFLFFCGGLFGLDKESVKLRIEEMIETLKLGDWLNKRTEEYSQGMKQRVAIASAFLHHPRLIILDEPMVGLDPQSAVLVKQFLKRKSEEGITVFMSTHSLNVVEEICTDVGIINKGKIIFSGGLDELLSMKNELSHNFETLFIELTSENQN